MQNINYSEDFTLVINLRNAIDETPAVLPDIDFDVRLKSGSMEYWAGRVRGELRNCRLEGAGDVLVVVCNNHRLPPCRELVADITYHLPDGNYADGVHDVTRRYRTGVCLTASECNMPSRAEFSALLPYIKGEKGDSFRLSEMSEEEREQFMEELKEDLGGMIVVEETKAITPEEIDEIWGEAAMASEL